MTELEEQTPEQLAAQLGSKIGKEAGDPILQLAKSHMLLSASRPGATTSEFKLSVLLVLGGLAMIGLGAYTGDATLQQQGVDLAKIVGAGYAASRGLAKMGARSNVAASK